jgi:ABC-type sugar transport system ATPase subunit
MFRDVSLDRPCRRDRGLAGLVGAGRSELARAIYGLYSSRNRVRCDLCGRPWRPAHPRDSLGAGLVYVPEERKRQGLVLEHSLSDAISIGFPTDSTIRISIPPRAQRRRVREAIGRYDIRASGATGGRHAQRRQSAKSPAGPLARARSAGHHSR